MTTETTNPNQIERGGVRIEIINSDPDGLPSYDRKFVFIVNEAYDQRAYVSVKDAFAIAKFLTANAIQAVREQGYKRLRRLAGFSTRPRDHG